MNTSRKFLMSCLSCAVAVVFTGCSSVDIVDRDFKNSIWEELWLEGMDALAEDRLVDARRILESAVKEARGAARNKLRLAITLDRLGDAYNESGMVQEAAKNYREALETLDQSIVEDKSAANEKIALKEQVGTLNSLARILVDENKFVQAEKLLEQAVTSATRIGGTNMGFTKDKLLIMDYGACLQSLGNVYERTGREKDAENYYVKASHFMSEFSIKNDSSSLFKATIERESAKGSTMTADDMSRSNAMIRLWSPLQQEANLALNQSDVKTAEAKFLAAYEVACKYKPASDQALESLSQLLRLYCKTHKFEQAEVLISKNFELLEKAPPSKPMDNVFGEMFKVYKNQGKWREAEKVMRSRVKMRETLRGPNNFHVAESLYDLGQSLTEQQRNPEAEFVLRKGLKILEFNGMGDHDLISKINARLELIKPIPKGKVQK